MYFERVPILKFWVWNEVKCITDVVLTFSSECSDTAALSAQISKRTQLYEGALGGFVLACAYTFLPPSAMVLCWNIKYFTMMIFIETINS